MKINQAQINNEQSRRINLFEKIYVNDEEANIGATQEVYISLRKILLKLTNDVLENNRQNKW